MTLLAKNGEEAVCDPSFSCWELGPLEAEQQEGLPVVLLKTVNLSQITLDTRWDVQRLHLGGEALVQLAVSVP